jgi:spermidine synthase
MAVKTSSARAKASAKGVESPPTVALPPVVAAAIVFVAAGSVLVLEILAVRLLAPYVGLTLETTTSIIGAVLLGIAAGAAIGGHTADRTNTRLLVVGLLIGGGLLVLLTVPIVRWLGPSAQNNGNLGALEVTFAALVPVAAILSAISPAVAHLQLHDLRASGTIVGRLSAWATAGALVGTFGTGFVLVPLLPVTGSVLAVGALLVVSGVLLGAYALVLKPGKIAGALLSTVALGLLGPLLSTPCDAETKYHCIRIQEDPEQVYGEYLVLDGVYNSYVDLKNPLDLGLFTYAHWISAQMSVIGVPNTPLDVVFVGGGGYTLPQWLEAARPGSHSTVLEVDGQLTSFDRKRLGLRTSPTLRAVTGDARLTLRDVPTHSADMIVGDAFSSRTVPWQLMTREWLKEVRRVLRPGGIYALNMIDFPPLGLLHAEAATLLDGFKSVRMVTMVGKHGRLKGGNFVMFASNANMPLPPGPNAFGAVTFGRAAVAKLAAGATPLRDDYAPVDQLVTRP